MAVRVSKIGSRYGSYIDNVAAKLPSSIGGTYQKDPEFQSQQQAAPADIQPMGAPQQSQAPEAIQGPKPVGNVEDQLIEEKGGIGQSINQIGKSENNILQAKLRNQQRAQQYAVNTDPGLGDFTGAFTGAGGGFDPEVVNNARIVAQVGRQMGFGEQDIQTALATMLAESGGRNLNYGDRDSVGLFQQRTSQGWGSVQQIMDPRYSASKFYDALRKSPRGATPWQTAQNVQRSAFADGSNYAAQWGKAQSLYGAIQGNGQQGVSTSPKMGANGSASWINANNGKYLDFDGAYGAQCVDLFNFYASGFVGANLMMGQAPYAKDLWRVHDRNAFVQVAANQRPQMGDVAVWSGAFNGGPGHVAIVAQDNGNGTIRVLNANATSAGPRGVTTMSNLSTGTLLGYLRPRKLM
jgi:surface antigen